MVRDAEFEQEGRVFYAMEHKVVCWYEQVPQQGPWHYPWVLVSTKDGQRYEVSQVEVVGE